MEHLPTSPESLPTSGGIHKSAPRKSRKRNDATGYLFTLFLTHVGNLNTVKLNQRRFAPTPAHIAGIKCPHHWNTHNARGDGNGHKSFLSPTLMTPSLAITGQ
jgi:hypothetical protein